MVDKVTYALHLKHLEQIKSRESQYPSYIYEQKPSCLKKSDKQIKMQQLKNEIKNNKKNIKHIKKITSPENRPPNYDYAEYFLQREIENMQKRQISSLLKKNMGLKSELTILKEQKYAYNPNTKRSSSVIRK